MEFIMESLLRIINKWKRLLLTKKEEMVIIIMAAERGS